MNDILFSGIVGCFAGAIVIIGSHLARRVGAGAIVRDIDQLRLFGKSYSQRASHVAGILIHLFLYAAAGIGFGALAAFGMIAHTAIGLTAYAIALELVIGGIFLPLEGHGLFGAREDAWFAVDLLILNAVWVILFEVMYRLVV